MDQSLQIYDKIQDPFAAAIQIGEHFAKSGMFGVDRREAGTILALACIVENKSPFTVARRFHIIEGKLSLKASSILADFRKAGGRHKWIKTGDDGTEAECEFTFEGNTIRVKFTIEDAKRMELVKPRSNWVKTPGNMLRARVITNGVGMLCPEITSGEEEPNESPVGEPKELLPKKTATKAEVIDVAAQPVTETASTVPIETKPVEPVVTAPAPAATAPQMFVAQVDSNGLLTPETINALSEVIGTENEAAAFKWLIAKNWITAESELAKLSQARAQKILDKPKDFVLTITGKKEGK